MKTDNQTQRDGLQVDSQGFILVEGVKICRFDPQKQVFLFLDKDRRRCAKRGSNQVLVSIEAIANLSIENQVI